MSQLRDNAERLADAAQDEIEASEPDTDWDDDDAAFQVWADEQPANNEQGRG